MLCKALTFVQSLALHDPPSTTRTKYCVTIGPSAAGIAVVAPRAARPKQQRILISTMNYKHGWLRIVGRDLDSPEHCLGDPNTINILLNELLV